MDVAFWCTVNLADDSFYNHDTHTRLYSYAGVVKSNKPCISNSCTTRKQEQSQSTVSKNSCSPRPAKQHTQPLIYPQHVQCRTCFHMFKTVRALKIHTAKVHKTDMVAGTKTVVMLKPESDLCCDTPSNTTKGVHNCLTCMKEFPSLKALRLHQFRKHKASSANDIIAMESEQQDLLATSSAGAGIDRTSVCNASVIGTKKFCCSACAEHFITYESLNSHLSKAHKNVKGSRQRSSQTDNINVKRTELNKLRCCLCKCRFTKAHALLVHQRKKHGVDVAATKSVSGDSSMQSCTRACTKASVPPVPAIEKYCCRLCNRDFRSAQGLKIHSSKLHSKISANVSSAVSSNFEKKRQHLATYNQKYVDRNR